MAGQGPCTTVTYTSIDFAAFLFNLDEHCMHSALDSYLRALQYGILHLCLFQAQAVGHSKQDVCMALIQLVPLLLTLLLQLLL